MPHYPPESWTPEERTVVVRYLAGDSSDTEAEEARRLLRQNPAPALAIELLRNEGIVLTDDDVRRSWKAIQRAVETAGPTRPADTALQTRTGTLGTRPVSRSSHGKGVFAAQAVSQRTWSSAVAFAGAVIVAIIGWNAGVHHIDRPASQSALTYNTAKGERATIVLPDGNTVALNVASRLEVPADYVSGDHTLRLSGEALFTVTHRDKIPITVIAGNTTARVLGTSFAVRQYPGDSTASVAVREGRVSVRSTVVAAGEEAVIGPHAEMHLQSASAARFSFVTGVITLEGMPLTDAIPQLNRWYDADIRLGDPSLAQQAIGGSFVVGSLTDLQRVLELTFNVRVVRDGRVLTLFPK